MRKAYNNYGMIVVDDKFVGVSLGFDFCAEHEWGIEGIRRICGIPEGSRKNMGVVSRTITKCPKLFFKEGKIKKVKHAIMYTYSSWLGEEDGEKYIPQDLANYAKYIQSDVEYRLKRNKEIEEKNSTITNPEDKRLPIEENDPIMTAWDGDSFGVAVYGDKETEWLKELYEAFHNNNVTIAVTDLRSRNPFSGSSLCLLITNRIPQETLDQMYMADKTHYDREDYEESIGMKKILSKHGNKNGYKGAKYFIACSPKWIDYENAEAREAKKAKMNTEYDIMYWVNYSDNDDNYGWYTVEEIREWMTGEKKLSEIRKSN